jgi:hypothetical protein
MAVGSDARLTGSAAGSSDAKTMADAATCPSTVYGSTTRCELEGRWDVVVTVTATDAAAVKEIQRRSKELMKTSQDDPAGTCPVFVPVGRKTTAKDLKNGVAITIMDNHPDALEGLIEDRIVSTANWVKANVKPGGAKKPDRDGDDVTNREGTGHGMGP